MNPENNWGKLHVIFFKVLARGFLHNYARFY